MKAHSTDAQRTRLLERLRVRPCSTIEARHELDIVSPAPRVYELRHRSGHNIHTYWTTALNPGGRQHRVANYVLLSGNFGENKNGI